MATMGSRGRPSLTASTPRMSKSVLSTTSPGEMESPGPEHSYFPFRLTATLAALKVVGGCLMVGLGAAAMVQQAAYSRQAGGIWAGIVVTISGVLGAYAVRTSGDRVAVTGFLASSVLSLVGSVVVVIYSATGLARDAAQPYGLRRDRDGNLVVWEAGSMSTREVAMLINTVLIIMGVLDVIFSLPSAIISLRELCQCYNPALLEGPASPPRKDMMAWLGQPASVFYSHASAIPYRPMSHMPPYPRASPPYLHIPSEPGGPPRPSPRARAPEDPRRTPRHRPKSPGARHHHAIHTQSVLAYPTFPTMDYQPMYYPHYPGHPSPPSNLSQPLMPSPYYPPAWLYPPDWEVGGDQRPHRREERRRQKEREQRKRSRSKSQPREGAQRTKRQKGPTDSDIERSYTGMDRDMAEEFIEQTMDPSTLIDQTMSGTESEAW